jgi:hypothetical protein
MRSTYYEAPYYVVFAIPLLPSLPQHLILEHLQPMFFLQSVTHTLI